MANTPLPGSSGLLQSILQKGPKPSQSAILQEKTNKLDNTIIESRHADLEKCRKRREIESKIRVELEHRGNLNPQLVQLEKGNNNEIIHKRELRGAP